MADGGEQHPPVTLHSVNMSTELHQAQFVNEL